MKKSPMHEPGPKMVSPRAGDADREGADLALGKWIADKIHELGGVGGMSEPHVEIRWHDGTKVGNLPIRNLLAIALAKRPAPRREGGHERRTPRIRGTDIIL